MKEIKAIVQPFKAGDILDALHAIEGVMNSDVRCTNSTRGALDPDINIKIELVVPDELAPIVVETIARVARTGHHGDGRIFVIDVESATMIRSGEIEV